MRFEETAISHLKENSISCYTLINTTYLGVPANLFKRIAAPKYLVLDERDPIPGRSVNAAGKMQASYRMADVLIFLVIILTRFNVRFRVSACYSIRSVMKM